MPDADRTERLLALLLLQQMRTASQQAKIVQLNIAGFSHIEIANILETTTPVVAQSLYAAKRERPTRKGSSRKSKPSAAKKRKRS